MGMKIAVLMSGGVDSSFAAYLLLKQGFDIVGITFLQLPQKNQKQELWRVQKIAEILSIPHLALDIQKLFKKEIVTPFLKSYQEGITPNPCPFCNKKIKLGLILKEAEKLGVEKIATGHYIRLRREIPNSKLKTRNYKYQLLKAKDTNKDQSYFLWTLSQKELQKLVLPLGDFTKEEVWQEIKKSPLKKIFQKKELYKESQDICFLKEKKLSEFLKKNLKAKPGPILNQGGKIIGKHQGIQFFTIGQRGGLAIGAKSPKQKPLYVIKIDKRKNAVIVGEEKNLYQKEILIEEVNWISGNEPKLPLRVKAKIRAKHKEAPATLTKNQKSNIYHLIFDKPQRALAPGQHAVFYQKNLLLGGGIIDI
jgi:tRNA-specific 2-thiouridylase